MSVKACTSVTRSILAAFVSILLVASLIPVYASAEPAGDADAPLTAQATLPASGTSGACTWEIDADGNLVVRPTDGVSGELEGFVADWLGTDTNPWEPYKSRVLTATFSHGVKASSDAEGMFRGCARLASVDFSGLDTSSVTSMFAMFDGCSSLASLDLTPPSTPRP